MSNGEWTFLWRRTLFVWEDHLAVELLADLEGRTWSDEEDRWRWELKDFGIFTVKPAYSKLEHLFLMEDLWREEERMVFSNLWKSPAPSKAIAFSWKLFLRFRNVLPVDAPNSCVMCDEEVESARHLFIHCEVALEVWREVMRWFGNSFITPPDFFIHWECWSGTETNKKIRKGLWLVWLTTM